jgi:hypothetical protein
VDSRFAADALRVGIDFTCAGLISGIVWHFCSFGLLFRYPQTTEDVYETIYMQLRCQLEERCRTWRQTYESIDSITDRLP